MKFEDSKTFIIAILAIILSFVGVWQKMFEADIFVTTLEWGLGVYGVKTLTTKVINKKPKE